MNMLEILEQFDITAKDTTVKPFGTGLINHTWMVGSAGTHYILQRVNENVFRVPEAIAYNIDLLAAFFRSHCPGYLFVAPVNTVAGGSLVKGPDGGYYRLFPFVEGSRSVDVVSTPSQAYEAAAQFGRFTRLLAGFNASQLKTTLPDFHNLSLRQAQFLHAMENGNPQRIQQASSLIAFINEHTDIVDIYEKIIQDVSFHLRVTHHDTKISNVLFDQAGKGLCVIDLDTVMPGYFISDVGDMMRTYLSPVSEEESDFSKIEVRDDFYEAIVSGYYGEMKDVLTPNETSHFFYAGLFMVYMQAIRFLSDHLLGDPYYGAKYEGHNLVRAQNQAVLLQRLMEKIDLLESKLKMVVHA